MSERRVALVTGASMGIGEAFVEALGTRGYDIALVARSADALRAVAARATAAGVRAEPIVADLAEPGAVERVARTTRERFGRVDLLVNNAGFGAHGPFESVGPERHAGMVRLNIESLVALTDEFAPAMLARGSGGIINVASVAGFQPVPYMAVYGATKAFVLSFSEALAEEFRGRGVRVLAICPGATRTNFFAVAGEGAQLGRFRTPAHVVQTALRAYDRGGAVAVDGFLNGLLTVSPRLAPRSVVARLTAAMMRPARATG